MLRLIVRTVIILLVAGLIAGGLYLFANNGGMSLVGAGGQQDGFSHGSTNAAGLTQVNTKVQTASGQPGQDVFRGGDGSHDQNGFSLLGLGGVFLQAAKIAVITALVVALKAAWQLLKHHKPVNAAAA